MSHDILIKISTYKFSYLVLENKMKFIYGLST